MEFTAGGSQGRLGRPLKHDANLTPSERKRERMTRECPGLPLGARVRQEDVGRVEWAVGGIPHCSQSWEVGPQC